MTTINVYYDADGTVQMECEGLVLEMSRQEAEQLFVDLGHVLQDMDIVYWGDKTGDGEDQPYPEPEGDL